MFCLAVCMIGAKMFARTSFVIFCIVMIALISVFVSAFIRKPFNVKIRDNNHQYNETVNGNATYTGFKGQTFKDNLKSK